MNELLNISILPVVLTLLAFRAGSILQQKTKSPLCNPILVAVILVLDLLILGRIDSPIAAAMNTGIGILGILAVCVLQYLFPLLAKFDAGTVQTLKNACLLAVAHLPRTLVMALSAVGILIITFYNAYTASIGVLLWMLIGFALMAFSNSSILVKIFDKLINP